VTKRPIGVWVSLALVVLLLCFWLGDKAGVRVAYARISAQRQTMGSLTPAEHARLSPQLMAFTTIAWLRFADASDTEKLRRTLAFEVSELEKLMHKPEMQDLDSVVKLNLGVAYVKLAIVEARANDASGSQGHVRLAQDLFRSLGWQDYSEETLKVVAQKELDRWALSPHPSGARK
jgi:hypothetical protein